MWRVTHFLPGETDLFQPTNLKRVRVSTFTDSHSTQETGTSDAVRIRYPCPTDADWCAKWTVSQTSEPTATFTLDLYFYTADGGSLAPATFTYAGTDYTITEILRSRLSNTNTGAVSTHSLKLKIPDLTLPDGTEFILGNTTLTVDAVSRTQNAGVEQGNLAVLNLDPVWTGVQEITSASTSSRPHNAHRRQTNPRPAVAIWRVARIRAAIAIPSTDGQQHPRETAGKRTTTKGGGRQETSRRPFVQIAERQCKAVTGHPFRRTTAPHSAPTGPQTTPMPSAA